MYNYNNSSKSYLITYDLHKPGQDYPKLYDAIKNCGSYWSHILDSIWIVKSTSSADTIRDLIHATVDENDSILIIEVTTNYSGWLTKDCWEVLRKATH